MSVPDGGAPSIGGDAAPHCYRHPGRETWVRCTRCDRPICPDCMRPASVGFHCPDDVRSDTRTARSPRNAVGAAVLESRPYVTFSLIAANVIVYLITGVQSKAGVTNPAVSASDPSTLFYHWQLLPLFVHDQGDYYELVTSAFLHANLLHIGSNMLALGVIGLPLESLLGRWRFAAVYLLAALGGSTAIYAFGNELQPTVGASGAIFGLFAVALVLVRKLGLNAQYLVGIVVLNFVVTFSIPGISKLAHIGGFLAGALAALAIGGLPTSRARVPARVQLAGLGGLLVLLAAVVMIRSATW